MFNEWKTQDLPQFMKYYAEIKTTYHKQVKKKKKEKEKGMENIDL